MRSNNNNNNSNNNAGTDWKLLVFRMLMFYFLYQFVFRKIGEAPANLPTEKNGAPTNYFRNLYQPGQTFDLYVYTSVSNTPIRSFDTNPLWSVREIPYMLQGEEVDINYSVEIPISEHLYNNGSYFAHIFICRHDFSIDPRSNSFDPYTITHVFPIVEYALKKKEVKKKNLLTGESNIPTPTEPTEEEEIETKERPIVSYWKPNITIQLVEDPSVYTKANIPPQMQEFFRLNYEKHVYYPILHMNEFWLLRENWIAINRSIESLPLTLHYSPTSMWKWQLQLQFEQSLNIHQQLGTQTVEDSDEFKRLLLDTNPYLLAVTMAVSLLHTIFDFLAFKNDITFWKNRKSLEGLSVRTLIINFVCQVIIFLYLCDNDTSWLILISSGVGLAIEAWKLRKAVHLEISWANEKKSLLWFLPEIRLKDKDSSYITSQTKAYDEEAMKYLSWVLFPLVAGYSVYSLYTESYKSWYSWVLGTLTGCVYTFGFIMMCPQLFINYKLKSVAHMPWKTMVYKALNTFIDDLFAFVIKMPTLHRLSCFRDDVIFLIFLYQRWIYKVDKTRVNEFGQSADDEPKTTANPQTQTQKN